MKKIISLIMLFVMLVSVFAGCGSAASQVENKSDQTSKKTINDILAESQAKNTTVAPKVDYPKLDYSAEVDLTNLNSNMVYSTVYSMVNSPEEYKGKTVKAQGTFDVFTDPKSGTLFYACVIADATACCSQGLEFVWKGDHSYPGDYPKVGEPITVGGVFGTYDDNGQTYCRLSDAELAV